MGHRRQILPCEGLVEIPVDGDIAIRAAALENFHRDPADRIIVATPLSGHQPLTADRRILDWPAAHWPGWTRWNREGNTL